MDFLVVGAWILSLIVVAVLAFLFGVGVGAFHARPGARITTIPVVDTFGFPDGPVVVLIDGERRLVTLRPWPQEASDGEG